MAGVTSFSSAPNVAAPRAFFTLATFLSAFGFSGAASAPGSLINPPWATLGTARLVRSRNYAHGCNGVARSTSGRDECTRRPITDFNKTLATTRPFENGARATRERTDQNSTALTYGDSVEIGLQCSVDGRCGSVDLTKEGRPAKRAR